MNARVRALWLLTVALGIGCDETTSDTQSCSTDDDCSRVCVFGDCLGATPGPGIADYGSGATYGSGGTYGNGSSAGGTGATTGGSGANAGRASAGRSSSGVSVGGAPGAACAPGSAGELDVGTTPVCLGLQANALVADPSRGKLYAVIGKDDALHANELLVIDPEHASIEASVAIGSNPDALALSDDATRLWVGLHGSFTVREVDLTVSPPAPGAEYPVPPLSFEAQGVYAGRLVVLPGSTESIALSIRCDGCSAEVAVMDAGTPRPNHVSDLSKLAPGPSGYVFGYNDLDTGYDFATLALDASGPTANDIEGLLDGFGTEITYDAGYVFASSGQVLDVSTPDSPVRAGTFDYQGNLVPHAEQQRVVMLSYSPPADVFSTDAATNTLALRELDLSAYRELFETALVGQYTTVHDFVEVKPGLFAFVDSQASAFVTSSPAKGSLYLFRAPDFTE
ncbi:MAG TPA: hypothetical protein VMI54_01135 [Polyangiaceae bacterium]|nr:hypothetical protein [Polyangiaceae bacterium]